MSNLPVDPRTLPPQQPQFPLANAASSPRGPMIAGYLVLILGIGGFGAWAANAPLSSATIAEGVVKLESNRKTVQHLEGGVIEDILVGEGTTVTAGQPLIRLDGTRAHAQHDLYEGRYLAALALEARLIAERDESKEIGFDEKLLARRGDKQIDEMIGGQERIFKERRKSLKGQTSIMSQRIRQFKQEIAGLGAQRKATGEQLKLIAEELSGLEKLYAKGHVSKTRLLAVRRAYADLEGDRGQLAARISEVKQSIGEARLRILQLKNDFQTEVASDLRTIQGDIAEISDRMRGQLDILDHLEITAPQSGIVVDLKFHTKGGVIPPRVPILDIVPKEDKLIIETRIQPQDIDVVHAGLVAQVRLSAYKRRVTPTVDGIVTHVSADRFEDPQTRIPYYIAHVELQPKSLDALDNVELYPGMPAEVMIEIGKRMALDYLLSPISERIHRAFREP